MRMAKNSAALRQIILIGLAVLLAAGPLRAAVDVPPEPQSPKRGQMSNDQFREAWAQWRTDHATWEASLTTEQLDEYNRLGSDCGQRPRHAIHIERVVRILS